MNDTEAIRTRLTELLGVVERSHLDPPAPTTTRFLWVFGSLIQEYMADRLFHEVEGEHDWRRAAEVATAVAHRWFGADEMADWPFPQWWLREYIRWRTLERREGTGPEDAPTGGRSEFLRNNPRSTARCQWFLGCPSIDDLQVDHKQAWSLLGAGAPDNYQWLCRRHNDLWKKTLLFWGDNLIPFKDYAPPAEEGQIA